MRADPKWTGVVTAYEFGLLPLGPVNDGFYKRDPSFPLGELPDLVLYLVMAFLDPKSLTALMKTCRRFYFTGKFHKSWTRKNQKIRIYHRSIEICVLIELLSRGIRNLEMDLCRLVPCSCAATHSADVHPFKQLSSLKITGFITKTTELELQPFILFFPALQKLFLRAVDNPAFKLLCESFSRMETSLTVISLATCQGLSAVSVTQLIKRSTILQKLDVSWMQLSFGAIYKILGSLPSTLIHLDLSGCSGGAMLGNVFSIIGDRCPGLQYLALMDCEFGSRGDIDYTLNKLQSLETLRVDRTHQILIFDIVSFASLPNIQQVSARHIELPDGLLPLRRYIDHREIVFNDPELSAKNDLLNDF